MNDNILEIEMFDDKTLDEIHSTQSQNNPKS